MKTPIVDFVKRYIEERSLRLHMPGHKGAVPCELPFPSDLFAWDITEIAGADSLYEADGIIAESERNAGALFGCQTLYSCEGSSLSIRAMLALAMRFSPSEQRPLLLAGRNAHRTLLSAAALLDFDIAWLYGEEYLSCTVTPKMLEEALTVAERTPFAVYLTSPDYLGRMLDIAACAEVCHRHGVLLLVDNAHGAYLKFLPTSQHPMDLGADLCCDSAHKTLPVLTGGGYLHLGRHLGSEWHAEAKRAMALFGSTSPSYLILQSLDIANIWLEKEWKERLNARLPLLAAYRARIEALGFDMTGDEPLKWTLCPKSYGYTGVALADHLAKHGITCEFADPDYTVLMLSPTQGEEALCRLLAALRALVRRPSITAAPPVPPVCRAMLSPRAAMLAPHERINVREACGRILADATVACPPAVPVVALGECIPEEALAAFAYYGITSCTVVCENDACASKDGAL